MADLRLPLALVLAGLAGACSGSGAEPAPDGETVACAVGEAHDLTEDCILERVHENGADMLVLHHPDGGFRRLIVLPSGGLIAADGADQAQVSVEQGIFAVSLGQDRYRIPQTMVAESAQ